MSSPLDEAYAVLDDFEKELAGIKAGWEQIAVDNPHLEQVSPEHWQETYYRMWLHGATNIWERNELGRWLYGNPPITETANSLAQDVHDAWRDWLETAGHQERIPSCVYDKQTREYREIESKKPGETYYASDDRFAIQAPHEGETLSTFIVRLARSIEDTGEGHRLQWRALKSFLDFIRNTYTTEQVAFIEHIFPKKMDVYYGRKITIYLAGKIPKGDLAPNDALHWTQHHMDYLQSNLSEFDIVLLNPSFKDCDLTDQDTVFGRDMHYVFSSDVIFVDARGSRGLGVGAEMMWAKINGIPVISWAPKDTHYNASSTMVLGTYIPDFIHPFVNGLSDKVVENLEEGAEWIRQLAKNPRSIKIKNSDSIHAVMEYYKSNQLQ